MKTMTKLEAFKASKQRLAAAERYFGMLDQHGHMNEKGRLQCVSISGLTIYFQAYAGAANYHNADAWMFPYLQRALVDCADPLRERALRIMRDEVAAAAKEAKAEADEVINELAAP